MINSMKNLLNNIYRYSPLHRKRLRSWLVVAGIVLGVLGKTAPQQLNYSLGVFLILPGILLHLACKAHLHQNKTVTRSGPYRWVRHPFYLANAMIDSGLCIMIGSREAAAAYAFFFIIAYFQAIRREERTLINLFGDEYIRYRREVPAVIPWKIKKPHRAVRSGFSLENPNIARGREGSRILRYVSYPYLFASASMVGNYGFREIVELSHWALIPPAAFLSLYWFAIAGKNYIKGKDSIIALLMNRYRVRTLFAFGIIAFLIITEGLIPEIEGPAHLLGTPLAAFICLGGCLKILMDSSCKAWFSTRFRRLFEMAFLVVMCFLSGLFYMIAPVIFAYVPAVLYAGNRQSPARSLTSPLVKIDLVKKTFQRYAVVNGLGFFIGAIVLFIQEIFHIHIFTIYSLLKL